MAEKKRRVMWTLDNELRGVLVEPGEEVSGVRWDGAREVNYVSNCYLVDEA